MRVEGSGGRHDHDGRRNDRRAHRSAVGTRGVPRDDVSPVSHPSGRGLARRSSPTRQPPATSVADRLRTGSTTRWVSQGARRSAAHASHERRAGVPDDIRRTPARAEVEASGGARSEAVPLLHRCTGSSDGLVHASERRRVQASDARPDEVQAPGPTAARRSHPPDTAGVTSASAETTVARPVRA
jgi:hypothetical protein